MKKQLSFVLVFTFVFFLPVQAQARMLAPSPKFPSTSLTERSDVSKGIYVGDELMTFSECILLDGKMSVMLPDDFTDMSLESAKIKYPSTSRPSVIKTNSDTTVNFLFTYAADSPFLPSDVGTTTKGFRQVYKTAYPATEFYNLKIETLGVKLGWYDFKSYALDTDIYNVFICFPIDGKLTIMGFNCAFSERKKWIPVIQAVLPTIKECETE